MWWDYQNLDQSRRDKSGERWHFRVWHDMIGKTHRAAVFYWSDSRASTGILAIPLGSRSDAQALHELIDKLVAQPALRKRHQRALTFPLDRHYSEPEDIFPPEDSSRAQRKA